MCNDGQSVQRALRWLTALCMAFAPPMYCHSKTNPGCHRKQACAALVNLSALNANQIRIRGTRGIESIKTCMATPGVSDHAKKMGQMLLDKLLLSSA